MNRLAETIKNPHIFFTRPYSIQNGFTHMQIIIKGVIVIDAQNVHLTEADAISYDTTSQILKAATAYVDPNVGRMFAVIAKAIELQNMMSYLEQNGGVSACSTGNRQIPPEEILKDLRKYCSPKEREQVDKCLNFMNMAKMYEMYKNLAGSADMASAPGFFANAGNREPTSAPSGNDNDYLRHMQSLLTPEQLQLLNNISSQQRK